MQSFHIQSFIWQPEKYKEQRFSNKPTPTSISYILENYKEAQAADIPEQIFPFQFLQVIFLLKPGHPYKLWREQLQAVLNCISW
jgi:hypothetical protein